MTDNSLLDKAIADRDKRPWRYYKLEYEELLKWLDKLADENDALKLCREPEPQKNK